MRLEKLIECPRKLSEATMIRIGKKMRRGAENGHEYKLVATPDDKCYLVDVEECLPFSDHTTPIVDHGIFLREFIELIPKEMRSEVYIDGSVDGTFRVSELESRLDASIGALKFYPGTKLKDCGEHYVLVRLANCVPQFQLVNIRTGTFFGMSLHTDNIPYITDKELYNMIPWRQRSTIEVCVNNGI